MTPSTDELPRMSDLSGGIPRFNRWFNNFVVTLGSLAGSAAYKAAGAGYLYLGNAGGVAYGALASYLAVWNSYMTLNAGGMTRNAYNIANQRAYRVGTPANKGGVVESIRYIVRSIQAAGTVDPGTLKVLGLSPHTKFRAVPEIPTAGPELTVDKSPPHTLVIRYHQEGQAEGSKKKPPGCKACLIRWTASNGVSGSMAFSKTPCVLDLPVSLTGTRVSIQATWVMGDSKESAPGNPVIAGVP